MTRKYSLRFGISSVNVSSSGHYYVDLIINWGARRRVGNYIVMDGTIIFQPSRCSNRGPTEVKQFPKYLHREILQSIQIGIKYDDLLFYEYMQDGTRRYKNLRYHDEQTYAHFCQIIKNRLGRL